MSRTEHERGDFVGAGCVMTYIRFDRARYTLEMCVLVVRGKESGKLSFPKGRMEERDRVPIVCAHREAREETGYVPRIDPETTYYDVHGYRYYIVGPHFRRLENYRITDPNTTFAGWVDMRYLEELARLYPDKVNLGVREFFRSNQITHVLKQHGID